MASLLRTIVRPLAMRAMLAREWWQSGVMYNPLSSRVYLNPYPKYAELRAKAPLHWSPLLQSWVATRYADVDAILRDQKRFSNDPRQRPRTRAPRTTVDNPGGQSMLFVDPPEHTRLRALVNKAFAPQAIAAIAPRIQAIVQELLDQIPEPSHFDFIETLAYPLPVIVMAELLGIPPQDRAQFKRWSDQRARALEPNITPREIQEANRAAHELDDYFCGVIKARRLEPRDDLISTLVATDEAGDRLTQDELLVMLRLLLIAGNETTTNLIGNGMLALLRHPDQLQKLRAHPDLMDTAVEEMLRYDTTVQVDFRSALEDVDLGGQRIIRGQGIMLLLGAANHDPEVFHAPEQFDITRREASHLSFGRGVHHCLGAPLARTEARLAFTGFLERFSDIRLLTEHPPFKDNVVLRGLRSLPIGATLVRVCAGP
jgi:cytochrome P450